MNPPRPRKAEVVLSGEPGKLLSVISSINASEKYDGRLLQRFTRRLRRLADLVNSGEVEKKTVTEALKLPRDEEAPPPLQETAPRQNRGVPRRHPEARREEAQRGQKTLCEKEKLHPDLQGHPGGGRGARRGREAPRENPEHRLQGQKAGQQPRRGRQLQHQTPHILQVGVGARGEALPPGTLFTYLPGNRGGSPPLSLRHHQEEAGPRAPPPAHHHEVHRQEGKNNHQNHLHPLRGRREGGGPLLPQEPGENLPQAEDGDPPPEKRTPKPIKEHTYYIVPSLLSENTFIMKKYFKKIMSLTSLISL